MIGGKNQGTQRPSALGSMLQAATYGMTIPNIIGTPRTALLAIWAANFRQGKCHGKKKKSSSAFFSPPQYIENIDFLIGSNPIANVLQLWYNSGLAHLNFLTYVPPFSFFAFDSITIPDPNFYAVVGVTWTPASTGQAGGVPYTFDDYGGTGPVTGSTVGQAIPLWNAAFAGPDPTSEYGQRFWNGSILKSLLNGQQFSGCFSLSYRWLPSYGPTVFFDENIAGGITLYPPEQLTIYYAQKSATIQRRTPIADNCLEWEPQLGSGSAYDDFESQRIIYPQYAGLSSPNLDLGSSGAMPSIRAEIMGSHCFYPRGDADFVDMAADTVKSGLVQLGGSLDGGVFPADGSASYVQRGVNLSDYPGTIQMKAYAQLDPTMPAIPYDFPVTQGDFLVVFASSRNVGAPLSISDTLGNTWTALYNGPAGSSHSAALWIAQTIASGNDTINIGPIQFDTAVQMFEVGGLDTFDGYATFSSATTKQSGEITTTNTDSTPGYALALTFTEFGGAQSMVQEDTHWNDLFNGSVGGSPLGVSIFFLASQRRLYHHPGKITINNTFAASGSQLFLVTFKNSGPVPYTRSLGNFIDEPSFELTRAQCRAASMWGDISMDSQRKASDWLKDFATCGLWEYVWTGEKLEFIPRSEVSATANGAIYYAPTSTGPVIDLTIDDLIGDSSTPCITVERKPQTDLPKILQAEIVDRNSNYDQLTVSWPDAANVAIYGPRKQSPQALHMIVDPLVATKMLSVQARHNGYIATLTYKFKGKAYLCILKPMALVTLTEPLLGFNKLPVRITSVSEDEDFNIDFEAEPFAYGAHSPDTLIATGAAPNVIQLGGDPGSVNAPIIFEAVPRLTGLASVPQLWIATSGASPNYGGVIVNISTDGGVSYNPVGGTQAASAWLTPPLVFGNALMGVTAADWPAANDPDTVNDLLVDLTESLGQLPSFAVADRDNFTNPFYVAGGTPCIPYELGAYNDAVLTAANQYTLKATGGGGNELRRCVFNAPVPVAGVDHPMGSAFVLLPPSGQGLAKLTIDPSWIGKTLFFKFQAFNIFQSNVQQLSDCTPYSYTITGCPSSGNNPGSYTLTGGALIQPCATPTTVTMAQATAVFTANTAIYNARTLTIPVITAPTLFYVTIYDPAMLGDTDAMANLNAFIETSSAKVGAPGYIFIGSILALPGGCGTGGGGAVPGMGLQPVKAVPLTPGVFGNFTVAHGLGITPTFIQIEMTAGSLIWSQTPTLFDNNNLFLVSGDPSATGIAYVFIDAADAEIALTPAADNFTIAHGLSASPLLALVEMTSAGLIQFQDPPWDTTNVYLRASDAGLTAKLEVMLAKPSSTIKFSKIALTPGGAGNFTVAHGLSAAPRFVIIRMKYGGLIWQQSPVGFDATNLYLVASDAGVIGEAEIWP